MARSQFLVSAAHKSSGKTTLGIGLARALRDAGDAVQTYKKGPDYIDPTWLAVASARPCYNLDYNVQETDEIVGAFHARDADVRVVEGNKGLFDGVDPRGSNSSAALARLLALRVVLIVDCEGVTRGVAPLLQGYVNFEDIDLAGVVLNRVGGERHASKLRAAVEYYTDLKVFGSLRRGPGLEIRERHLGLVPCNEHHGPDAAVASVARAIEEQVDVRALLEATRAPPAPRLAVPGVRQPPRVPGGAPSGLRIAIARDEAFGFYYADDLDEFARAGADLVYFSPIRDARLPVANGVFLGGGFPESYAAELSRNRSMKDSIRGYARAGGVVYAECGGLMYLCESLRCDGGEYSMVGLIPAAAEMRAQPIGRGYIRVRATAAHPWRAARDARDIRAHEFHYSSLSPRAPSFTFGYEVTRGHGVDGRNDGIVVNNVFASYLHQRHTRQSPWIHQFLRFVRHVGEGSKCPSS